MNLARYLNKNNLHHAYLIEGERDAIIPEIFSFCKNLNIKTSGNPDFCYITVDNFKIDEAFDLRAMSTDKSFSLGKKVFVICVNSFSLDAQNVLLKMFEEPIENTHFFLVVPDTNSLLKTLASRFYLIKNEKMDFRREEAEKFIRMSLQKRIDFIKELLIEPEEEDAEGNEVVVLPARNATHSVAGGDSTRSKTLKFLNALEVVLHGKFLKNFERCGFHSILREGSSRKNFLQICYAKQLPAHLKISEFLNEWNLGRQLNYPLPAQTGLHLPLLVQLIIL